MDIFETFAVDEKKLTDGVWHVIEPTTDYAVDEAAINGQCAVLVASMDSPAYRQAIERKLKPSVMRRGQADAAVRERVTNEAIAETIILDWRNWVIAGEHVPYSHAKALEFLTQPKWVRLRDRLMGVIGDVDAFKIQQEGAIIKNS